MFLFYDQLINYLYETRDCIRLIALLITRLHNLAKLNKV